MNSSPNSPKRRGRPKTSAKTQPANPAAPEGQHTTTNEDVLAGLVDRVDSKSDLKAKMTQRELKFLEIYLTGKHNIDKAMILAGFEGYHPNSLYRLGRKIVQKYEHQAGDHRKIFRAIGAGEVAVAQGLLKLAQNAKSEMVQLNAWSTLAKCLGLTKEILEGVEGIQIVINSSRGLGDKPGQHRPDQVNRTSPGLCPRPSRLTNSGTGYGAMADLIISGGINMSLTTTPIKTIRALCLRCAGNNYKTVRECCQKECPGWPYRMGRHPLLAGRSNSGSFVKTPGLRRGKNSEST